MLDAEPGQDEAMAVCLRAWRYLGTTRPMGFAGAGPIPAPQIDDWIDREGLDALAARVIRIVIARLDNDFLDAQASNKE